MSRSLRRPQSTAISLIFLNIKDQQLGFVLQSLIGSVKVDADE